MGIIITLLVTVKGHLDPNMIKKRLSEDVLEKRQKDGTYAYRHLRMTPTSKWGSYAWQSFLPFNIDDHLVVSNPMYSGRPVTESNVQEYVSEIVPKFLVPDLPPWQINIKSSSAMDKYYLLVRIHHILLSHADLDLEDLLMLNYSRNDYSVSKLGVHSQSFPFIQGRCHPFQELYKTPKAIPVLYDQLCETFGNNWNEFVSMCDPIGKSIRFKKNICRNCSGNSYNSPPCCQVLNGQNNMGKKK